MRELSELNARLARIEEAIPILAAYSAGSTGEAELVAQRRSRQALGSRYLAERIRNRSSDSP